ncbi:uncharacterized protein LOC62_01G001628 [Vanrija pseudolonga]|uniref:Uncharacterized protein n=1 Tax=Vanrija pseudolonga TaxID=143232 RepID=A0AAF1BHV6_9TREE|nr:hypothetical protein LOC62_01G001628 [Vanrija pseudolonga]
MAGLGHDTAIEWSAASIIFGLPHLVDSILDHATRVTLVTFMRVNEDLHNEAGKRLYHTVRIDGHNMAGFFRGAIEPDDVDSHCVVSASDDCKRAPDEDYFDTLYPPVELAKHGAERGKFKAALLARVRVLSIGRHHTCVCNYYSTYAKNLLCNLDTLRLVPAIDATPQPSTWCDDTEYYDDHCRLLMCLEPRKIVWRNLGANPMIFFDAWPDDHLFNATNLKEVVVACYADFADQFLIEDVELGPGTKVKVIFNCQWEEWAPRPSRLYDSDSDIGTEFRPPNPQNIVNSMIYWSSCYELPLAVVGLETVSFIGRGGLVTPPATMSSAEQVKNAGHQQFVKNALIAGYRNKAQVQREEGNKAPDFEGSVLFQTLDEYAALPESERCYELHDGLPPRLE